MRIGVAADHGGFSLKEELVPLLRAAGHEVIDYGASEYNPADDYPDFVAPLSQAVSRRELDRGIAICGSGVGACIAANKIPGVRSSLITDVYSAHQGVEHDDMNVMSLGAWVTGRALAWDLIQAFLAARFSGLERHTRRLGKVAAIEQAWASPWNGDTGE